MHPETAVQLQVAQDAVEASPTVQTLPVSRRPRRPAHSDARAACLARGTSIRCFDAGLSGDRRTSIRWLASTHKTLRPSTSNTPRPSTPNTPRPSTTNTPRPCSRIATSLADYDIARRTPIRCFKTSLRNVVRARTWPAQGELERQHKVNSNVRTRLTRTRPAYG
ncbi:hypothetical protein BD626DRAFT_151190 [Schizophyllum amplum]|uniref:Uncharacterized protein n=1 Tax=Schizophyllum amplum TaxID=97359 RepID=A0A550C465_9AGAR|nr:hypothetical protein BD626DRAFT_151190 [Auriculariopsis ampla]